MASDGNLNFDTKIDESGFNKGISKLGGLAKAGVASIGAMMGAGIAAFGAVTKASLDSVASMEQNIGGVETLFKDSADTVIANANRAYKTAGMSANEYMSNVTSFSASLLQSLAGDTQAAAEVADMAMIDMSDNANKMGTDMESIQNAYQGFAKQNYTMLDNLKLGYGGTKSEMERLLADAEKLTGVKYDINNLSDVYKAIHAIQENLGITGTTAEEAASTIEGSMNSAKAAWDNFLAGTATAEEFADAFGVAAENIIKNLGEIVPRLAATIPVVVSEIYQMFVEEFNENGDQLFETGSQIIADILTGIVGALPQIATIAVSIGKTLLDAIGDSAPQMVDAGNELMQFLIDGMDQLSDSAPEIVEQATEIVSNLMSGIEENAPQLLTAGVNMLSSFVQGIAQQLPQLVPQALQMVATLANSIISNLPTIINAGISLLKGLVQGLINSIPILVSEGPRIINDFTNAIYSGIGNLILAGLQMIQSLAQGLWENKGVILENAGQILLAIINVFSLSKLFSLGKSLVNSMSSGIESLGGNITAAGKDLLTKLVSGIKSLATHPVTTLKNIATNAMNAIKNVNWGSVGKGIIDGIVNGLKASAKRLVEAAAGAATDALNWVKNKLGIHSPSTVFRDQVGKMMALGIGVGFEKNIPLKSMNVGLQKAVNSLKKDVVFTTSARSGKSVGEIKSNSEFGSSGGTDWDEWERRQRRINKERDSRPIYLGTNRIDRPLPKGAVPVW